MTSDLAALPRPQLPIALFSLRFQALDPLFLHDYPGAKWRGMVAASLRRQVCIHQQTECQDCEARYACAYSYLFNAFRPPDAQKMTRYEKIPCAYVIKAQCQPGEVVAGASLHLRLALFGKAQQFAQPLLQAFADGAKNGLTRKHKRLRLDSVEQIDITDGTARPLLYPDRLLPPQPVATVAIPEMPDTREIRLTLDTPLRIEREQEKAGKRRQFRIDRQALRFADLFGQLLRRNSLLTCFYGDIPLETDFRALTDAARAISFSDSLLIESRCGRYAKKQQKWLDKSGYVGYLDIPTEKLQPFWPYLWMGQYCHAGYGGTIGMGGYTIGHKSS